MNIDRIVTLALAAVPATTAVLTTVIGWRSDDDWAALVEGSPRLAGVVKLVRAVGLDVPGVVRALRTILTRPAPPNRPEGKTP
jgi:hypothetical protein